MNNSAWIQRQRPDQSIGGVLCFVRIFRIAMLGGGGSSTQTDWTARQWNVIVGQGRKSFSSVSGFPDFDEVNALIFWFNVQCSQKWQKRVIFVFISATDALLRIIVSGGLIFIGRCGAAGGFRIIFKEFDNNRLTLIKSPDLKTALVKLNFCRICRKQISE